MSNFSLKGVVKEVGKRLFETVKQNVKVNINATAKHAIKEIRKAVIEFKNTILEATKQLKESVVNTLKNSAASIDLNGNSVLVLNDCKLSIQYDAIENYLFTLAISIFPLFIDVVMKSLNIAQSVNA